ncbi:hypothetical protein ACO0LN_25985 [Undibacterium sp. TC9W]
MGKAKPVRLSNGREWSKKGEAADHFQEMLGKYTVGERVYSPDDHSDVVALVEVYDAEIR